jgi:uncharacterized protein with HEPN domain
MRPDDHIRVLHMIEAMRNRLIHAYFDIDRDILWKTATIELQALLPRLKTLISKE